MTITFVVQSFSTCAMRFFTLLGSSSVGRYTSKSPFTLRADSSLQKLGLSKPSLQSRTPECGSNAKVKQSENSTAHIGNIVSRLVLSVSRKRRLILFGILEIDPLISDESILEIAVLDLLVNESTESDNESTIPFFAMPLHTRRETTCLQPHGKHVL